ncbi:MAG: DegV family protein [Thermovirgaceae bacterium]
MMKKTAPPVRTIDGRRFRNAFVAGTLALESRRTYLNSINVFPVPDGDTGDNMASTCRFIIDRVEATGSIVSTSAAMAEAALEGARGNSGIILTQFLYGLSRALENRDEVDAATLGKSLAEAIPHAEQAVHRPVEGTILTVMRDWTGNFEESSRRQGDFASLLKGSLEAARASLLDTPRNLEILAREHVVDAGAQGFVDFLQGVADFLEKGNLKDLRGNGPHVFPVETNEHGMDALPAYRYCAEAVVAGGRLSREDLVDELEGYGDSIVVGGHEGKYRIHLHTSRPDDLFARLAARAGLNVQKAEDMYRQVETVRKGKRPTALLTDSACDLPQELMDRYGIHMVPLKLSVGGNSYLDKVSISPRRVYQLMQDTDIPMTTSQPGMSDFDRLYSLLGSHFDSVIAIHLSRALSGTWNASMKAAAGTEYSGSIRVIDSRTLCSAQGLIVLHAARAIEQGKTAQQVRDLIERTIPRTRIFVSLSTLEYMVRGGRIRPLTGRIAGVLNLKPVITVDSEGRGAHFGRPGSERSNLRKMVETFENLQQRRGLLDYAVVHAAAPEKAEKLAEELSSRSGLQPAYITEISPVIGIHSGPGSVAVSLILED